MRLEEGKAVKLRREYGCEREQKRLTVLEVSRKRREVISDGFHFVYHGSRHCPKRKGPEVKHSLPFTTSNLDHFDYFKVA